MRSSSEARVVANRYARALLAVALAKKEDPERIDRDLQAMMEVVDAHPELARTLGSPAIVATKRVAVMDRLVKRFKFSPLTVNSLRLMAGKERISILDLVRESFRRALDEHLGVEMAEVVTAVPLDRKQQEELTAKLRSLTGKEVRASFRADAGLIGGLVVRLGNRIYDASITRQLERFRERLLATY